MIRGSGDWRGEALSRLRGLVLAAGAGVVEEVKWKKPSRPEGVPVWSSRGIVCTGEMLKSTVRLTFPKGALMSDPEKLFNARLDSRSVRAIDFSEGAAVPEAALQALVVEAVGLNARNMRGIREVNGGGAQPMRTNEGDLAHRAAERRRDDGAGSRREHRSRSGPGVQVPGGTVHEVPPDLRMALAANPTALDAWSQITPLGRNEFICWVDDAKQEPTRQRRIRRTQEELEEGLRRPCCWPGCRHREHTGR